MLAPILVFYLTKDGVSHSYYDSVKESRRLVGTANVNVLRKPIYLYCFLKLRSLTVMYFANFSRFCSLAGNILGIPVGEYACMQVNASFYPTVSPLKIFWNTYLDVKIPSLVLFIYLWFNDSELSPKVYLKFCIWSMGDDGRLLGGSIVCKSGFS